MPINKAKKSLSKKEEAQFGQMLFDLGRLANRRNCNPTAHNPANLLKLEMLNFVASDRPLMKAVADRFGIKAPSVTSMVNVLVRAGLIIREPDKIDRRVVHLVITDKGQKNLKEGMLHFNRHLNFSFSSLTKKEKNSLLAILQKIIRSIKK